MSNIKARLFFERDKNDPAIVFVGIYSDTRAVVLDEIRRLVASVDESGGYADIRGPFQFRDEGFIAGGPMTVPL